MSRTQGREQTRDPETGGDRPIVTVLGILREPEVDLGDAEQNPQVVQGGDHPPGPGHRVKVPLDLVGDRRVTVDQLGMLDGIAELGQRDGMERARRWVAGAGMVCQRRDLGKDDQLRNDTEGISLACSTSSSIRYSPAEV